MLNLSSIMVGTMRPKEMAEFYEKVFEKKPEMEEEGWYGWLIGSCFISIGQHSEMSGTAKDPGRIMFNFETTEVKEEYDRMIKIGATSIKEPYELGGAWIATLADPDGNYFQLMTPWKAEETKLVN